MIAPYWDRERRTCIVVHRTDSLVKYIPLEVAIGLEVLQMKATEFDQKFSLMVNYSAEKACRLYASYAQTIGATKEALDFLGKLIEITDKEYTMATTKKNAAAVKSVPAKKASAVSKEPTAGSTPKEKPAKAVQAAKGAGKKPSAAQMFQDLIMEGKLTDDQIFEKVQAEFGLDEKKRAYVKWYRNNLRKQGKNPPDAK
jgi:hypothetical protein